MQIRPATRFSRLAKREGLVEHFRDAPSILEIGPFSTPTFAGPQVRYFDVLSTSDLRKRARELSLNPDGVPEIHFFAATGDPSVVDGVFDLAFSAHCIEHQPDLAQHLKDVEGF